MTWSHEPVRHVRLSVNAEKIVFHDTCNIPLRKKKDGYMDISVHERFFQEDFLEQFFVAIFGATQGVMKTQLA